LLDVVLYDHNDLDPEQSFLASCVSQIYDHHIDLTKSKYPKLSNKTVTFCGSAMSLILTQKFDCIGKLLDTDLAKFCIAPILIDTKRLKPKLKNDRWNEIDKLAYQILSEKLSSKINIKSYYTELKNIMSDLSANFAQGVKTLLLKDYKVYKVFSEKQNSEIIFGCAAIDIPLTKFLAYFGPEKLLEDYKEFIKEKDIKFLIVLGKARKTQRDMLIYCPNAIYLDVWRKMFEDKYGKLLHLACLPDFKNMVDCYYYTYDDLSYTRKKQEPLWRDICEKC